MLQLSREGFDLIDVTIFHLDKKSNLIEKIVSKKANIKNNLWILHDVKVFKPENGILKSNNLETYKIDQSTILIRLIVYSKILIQCPF